MTQRYLLLILALATLFSCKKHRTEEAEEDTFDRTTMLASYADEMIAPALADFQTKSDSLYLTVLHFVQKPSQGGLDSVQSAFRQTTISWQYCSAYRLGPVMTPFGSLDNGLNREDYINTYPANVAVIESFIAQNFTTLTDVDFPSRGLNAIDYLLNDLNGLDSSIINKFNASNARKEYLKILALDIKSRASVAYSGWLSYRDEFVANNGTSATSSVSALMMQFIIDFETFKNLEIGFPVGRILPMNTLAAAPEKTQCYYSGNSLELAKHHFQAIENIWYGKDGKGFKRYLEFADGGVETSEATVAQINLVKAKQTLIPNERLSTLILTNKQPVSDYYTEILKLTHFLKSDMPSKLGIYITYASGDGTFFKA